MPNTKEMITITKAEYDKLVEREQWLCCLEAAGVDNWCGYGEAFDIKEEWEAE